MNSLYYEVHITLVTDKIPDLKSWSYSKIDKDIVLGEGVKSYLTKHFTKHKTVEEITLELEQAKEELIQKGFTVLRTKIESVIYDSKINHIKP